MHNAAEQIVSEYAAPVQEAHFGMAGLDQPSQEARIITADKFRSLKAKLSSKTANPETPPASAPTIQIPDLLAKVRAVRQASNFVDVWAALEVQLAARPLPVEEEKPEILAAPAENAVEATPEPLAEVRVIEELANNVEPSLTEAVTAPVEIINLEVPAQTELVDPPQVDEPLPQQEPAEAQELVPEVQSADLVVVEAVAPDDNQVVIVESEVSADEPASEPQALYDSLSERLGPQVSILRKLETAEEDAFASIEVPQPSTPALADRPFPTLASVELEEKNAVAFNLSDASVALETPAAPESASQTSDTDPQAGEVARSLLDIMSAPSGATQPQERALASDMLLRLVPRIPLRPMIALVDRICIMDPPPPLLVARLIKDKRSEIAGPILERCTHIADQDLLEIVVEGDPGMQRMIARRRHISAALSDTLVERGDPSVILTLVRNPGAAISHEAFYRLCLHAKDHPSLQAPLTTRADTPAPVAFELFWLLPVELRRYVLSRFLTDSETLNKLLKMASAVDVNDNGEAGDGKFPEKKKVDALVALIEQNELAEAIALMQDIAGVHAATARRILADADGEPLTVVFKAIGMTRAGFAEAIARLGAAPEARLRQDRNAADLQSIFDSLSFNKARVLLTYWDWAADEAGKPAKA